VGFEPADAGLLRIARYTGTLTPHPRLVHYRGGPCPHFPPDHVGPVVFKSL
jgi:hypothetical protein